VARSRSSPPISSATAATARTSSCPLARPGVPTQISAMSLASTASRPDIVAVSRPCATTSLSSASNPGSTIGERPAASMATLSGLMSTPITW